MPIASNRREIISYIAAMPTATATPVTAPRLPAESENGIASTAITRVTSGKANFRCNLDFQAHYIETTLLQVVNIAAQFLIIHLRRLLYFFLEIGRLLIELREGRHVKGAIAVDGFAAQIARSHPCSKIQRCVTSDQWARSAYTRWVMLKDLGSNWNTEMSAN